MKLLIIAGFLGSGKTTLLLEIARKLTAIPEKVAIIENEIGEIGIDGNYIRQHGLEVQELFGGCICCTLSVGLIETLEKVKGLYDPKWVILEATGIARPGDIIPSVRKYGKMVKDIVALTIVDAVRFEMLMEVVSPLLTAQIEAADIVAVNKIDEVEAAKVDRIIQSVSQLNPRENVVAISAEERINLEPLIEKLL